MAATPEQWMRTVALRLGELRDAVVFLGGAVLALLVDDQAGSAVRMTDDVDVVVDVPTTAAYQQLEAKLQGRGFVPDTSEGAPVCRKIVDGVTVDVMPADAKVLGFSNRWYREACQRATVHELEPGLAIRVVTAPYFLATKLEAFLGRGRGDYQASHDLEDLIAIVDGRARIVGEVEVASDALRTYLHEQLTALLSTPAFVDAVPGHLAGDAASQARCPLVLDRLRTLAAKPGTLAAFRTTQRPPMAIKKSELYSSIWKSCDELRGGMDASQYKDYVLVLLFVKYVSDKAASKKHADIVVPVGGGFADMVALKGKADIGDKMNQIVRKLAEKNADLVGIIDLADWNDDDKLGKGAEKVARLTNLVSIFDNPALDFRGNRADGDDLLGDAYEYLMRHFATESGKSKGQFYTPAEVSRVMAKVVGVGGATSGNQTIHDPTCGSGSLLLKAHDEAKRATGKDLTLYGQEKDNATRALAKMNTILHDCARGDIWQDNTLSSPHFVDPKTRALKTFDFVVANPPFSDKAWTNGVDPANDEFKRFALGIPPKKNGDFAFLLHVLACLKPTGRGAIILPHGVLFRGGAEASIRRELVRRGYLEGIIGLPANLFYGTGIPACILVLDKAGAAGRTGIFMVDASRGFKKDGPKNRLREQDLHKIVDTYQRRLELDRYARLVPMSEIADEKNDFNLNLPRYIDASEPEDLQDLEGHLKGGIPERDLDELAPYWQALPGVREALFRTERPGYAALTIEPSAIRSTITEHPAFQAWSQRIHTRFESWRKRAEPRLRELRVGDNPRKLIEALSEDLLDTFRGAELVDAYDVYQGLMNYWVETMQDDVGLVVAEGWLEAAKPRVIDDKDKKSKDRPDFVVGKKKFKAELIPPAVLIARYFAVEQAALDGLVADAALAEQELAELLEEHDSDEGLLSAARNSKDKVTKASVTARRAEIGDDPEFADERTVLDDYVARADKEATVSVKARSARDALTASIAAKYGTLAESDVKQLVVSDRWLESLVTAVRSCTDRATLSLAARGGQLANRYAAPLPSLLVEVSRSAARVDGHVQRILSR